MQKKQVPFQQKQQTLKSLFQRKNLDKETLKRLKSLKKNFEIILKKNPEENKSSLFRQKSVKKKLLDLQTKEKLPQRGQIKIQANNVSSIRSKQQKIKLFKNNFLNILNVTKPQKSFLQKVKNKSLKKTIESKNSNKQIKSFKNKSQLKNFKKKSAILMNKSAKLKIKKIFSKSREKIDSKKQIKFKLKKIKRFETEINVDNNSISTKLEKSHIVSNLFSQKSIQNFTQNQNKLQRRLVQKNIDVRSFEHETFQNYFSQEQQQIFLQQEKDLQITHDYFDQQKYLNPQMRSFLINWVQEVSTDYMFKRLTFNYAVYFIDCYLSKIKNVQKEKFQLIGLVALLIAAKNEEIYTPKIENLSIAADNAYSDEEIIQMERKMFKILNYQINPPTLELWSNLLLTQWDIFQKTNQNQQNYRFNQIQINLIFFRKTSVESYQNFREVQQILDCCLLDHQHLKYKKIALVASTMYLLIGQKLNLFKNAQIHETFPYTSSYLLNQNEFFNSYIDQFLQTYFEIQVTDLLPTIQYIAKFFGLMMHMDFPVAAKIQEENVVKNHFENFLSFQTFNPFALNYVLKENTIGNN